MKKPIILVMIFNFFLSLNPLKAQESNIDGDYVVILHGIARSKNHMKKLEKFLQKDGYQVVNIDYPSTKYPIQKLTDIINKEISERVSDDKKIHFIGYSMGSLMTRALIHKFKYKNLGRVVHLAPPNNGSEVADFMKDYWIYKTIFGPAGQQLVTNQNEFQDLFGEVNYELGIIAGNSTIDPISSAIIKKENDGKVSVESTKLAGMKDHIIIKSSHTFFPYNKKVQMQTLNFLKYGQFNH